MAMMNTKVRVVPVVRLRLAAAVGVRRRRREEDGAAALFWHKIRRIAVAHPVARTTPLTFSTFALNRPDARNNLVTFCRAHGLGFEESKVPE